MIAAMKNVCFIIIISLLFCPECSKPRKLVLTKDQKTRIEDNIIKEAPNLEKMLNANLDNSIKLLGVELSKKEVNPGDELIITYFWECLKEMKGEWKVFVHLELPGPNRLILDHNPVQELYPINQWKKGEIIKDEQRVAIDGETKPGEAVLWMGVFNEETWREQKGGDRLAIANANEVPNDGDKRIKAATFTVLGKQTKEQVNRPKLRIFRANSPITIDGKLDEIPWTLTPDSPAFRKPDGTPAEPSLMTTVKALYDDENLYLAFSVKDDDISSSFTERDSTLWEQDVVEIYLDPEGDSKDYLELQISPANIIFDALFEEHRKPDWKEACRNFNGNIKSAVTVNGSLNKKDDQKKDEGYVVEVAIPFKDFKDLKKRAEQGTEWVANFFRIEGKTDSRAMSYQAFSPAGGDFHDLSKAGFMVFAGSAEEILKKAVEGAAPKSEKKDESVKPALPPDASVKINPNLPKMLPSIRKTVDPSIIKK